MITRLTPIQTLLLGFLVLIAVGGVLLWLPISSASGRYTPFIDALFTATSAVTTTGLVVVETGSHFSTFGQLVILSLIQICALGYMLFITLVSLGLGGGLSISGRLLLTESIARPSTFEVRKFVKAVIGFTVAIEVFGAVLLTLVFLERYTLLEAVYSGIFHSISSFCTAGFSLYADSFTTWSAHGLTNGVLALITIAGGIGFFVLYDLAQFARKLVRRDYPRKLSDHSKFVLTISALLMAVGTCALFVVEYASGASNSIGERFLASSFQALSASTTTGYNSVDIGALSSLSLVYIIALMFIGGSPGSTAAGIKTTTFGIILLFIRSVLTNREDVTVFRRTIVPSTVRKALGIGLLASLFLGGMVLALQGSEDGSLLAVVFEATSALGNVGLSTGVTPSLTHMGKVLVMITMFIGRFGPLAIGYSLVGRFRSRGYAYPDGNVMVG